MGVRRSLSTVLRVALRVGMGTLVVLGLGSCQLVGVTKLDRLSQFGADLSNSDKSRMSANFAQDQTTDYAAVIMQGFWDGIGMVLPGATDQSYSLSVHDYVDPAHVTADIYGPPLFNSGGTPIPAVFVLVQIGTDWFIEKVYLNGSTTPAVQ